MKIDFIKCHGLGNDFVLIDAINTHPGIKLTLDQARFFGDRHLGVGCDQILILRPAKDPANHAYMEILNSDGSVAEMCGNGIRAACLYLSRSQRAPFSIETLGGIKKIEQTSSVDFKVNMGAPQFERLQNQIVVNDLEIKTPTQSQVFKFYEISMGNPHAVIFVSDLDKTEFNTLGPLIENHPRFLNKTNVEFVQIKDGIAHTRVWERGAGPTLACGTGACAVGVAAIENKRALSPLTVRLPGGDLKIEYSGHDVFMTGSAAISYNGSVE